MHPHKSLTILSKFIDAFISESIHLIPFLTNLFD